jgi:copper chaperone CopZ
MKFGNFIYICSLIEKGLKMEKKTIPVVGMACAACSANVERKLNNLDGIKSASVSLPGRSALVEYDPDVISLEQMKDQINGIGYDLVIEEDRSATQIEHRSYVLLTEKGDRVVDIRRFMYVDIDEMVEIGLFGHCQPDDARDSAAQLDLLR